MVTMGHYTYGRLKSPFEKRCESIVKQQMIAEGWKTYANKFDRVLKTRTRALMNKERQAKRA